MNSPLRRIHFSTLISTSWHIITFIHFSQVEGFFSSSISPASYPCCPRNTPRAGHPVPTVDCTSDRNIMKLVNPLNHVKSPRSILAKQKITIYHLNMSIVLPKIFIYIYIHFVMHFYNLHFIHHPSGHIMWSSKNLQFPPAMQQLLTLCLDAGGFTDGILQAPDGWETKLSFLGRPIFRCYDAMLVFRAGFFLYLICDVFLLYVAWRFPKLLQAETYQQIEVLLTKTLHSNHVQQDCFGLTQMLGLLSFYSLMLQHDCWILPPPISPKAPKWPICCELQLAKLTTQAMYCHVQGPLVR